VNGSPYCSSFMSSEIKLNSVELSSDIDEVESSPSSLEMAMVRSDLVGCMALPYLHRCCIDEGGKTTRRVEYAFFCLD